MGEQKPEKTKKHICAGLLAHVSVSGHHLQQYHHGKAGCHGRRSL